MAKAKWTQTKYPGIYKYELKSGVKYGIRVRYQDANLSWKEKSESGFSTISSARKRKTELESTINNNLVSNFNADKMTFEQWYKKFLEMRIPIWSPETRYKVEMCYKNHLSTFKSTTLSKLTLIQYQRFVNQKLFEEGLALSSMMEYHRIMMSIINDAVKHEVLSANKLSKVTISKDYTPKEKVLSSKEVELFDELAKEKLKTMPLAIYTLLRIGWRTSEVMGLTKKAVVILSDGEIDLPVLKSRTIRAPKGKSPKTPSSYRTNRIGGERAKVILAALQQSEQIHAENNLDWNDDSFIFINHNTLKPFHTYFASQIIARLSKKLSIRATPHMFRHSFASHALSKGHNVVEISNWLGHKDTSTTLNIYSHSIEESRDKLVDFASL